MSEGVLNLLLNRVLHWMQQQTNIIEKYYGYTKFRQLHPYCMIELYTSLSTASQNKFSQVVTSCEVHSGNSEKLVAT